MADENLIQLTADIVSAHVANNSVAVGDVATLVRQVYSSLEGLGAPAEEATAEKRQPAVTARASVKPDHLVCMICGSKNKMLKRHLQSEHGLTPAEYRAEFGLRADYPMVAPDYSNRRRELAHASGLGRKREAPQAADAPQTAAPKAGKGAKPGRRKKDAAPATEEQSS